MKPYFYKSNLLSMITYDFNKYNELKDLIIKNNIINDNGCLIIEHEKKTVFEHPNIKTRKYGEVNFSIFYI